MIITSLLLSAGLTYVPEPFYAWIQGPVHIAVLVSALSIAYFKYQWNHSEAMALLSLGLLGEMVPAVPFEGWIRFGVCLACAVFLIWYLPEHVDRRDLDDEVQSTSWNSSHFDTVAKEHFLELFGIKEIYLTLAGVLIVSLVTFERSIKVTDLTDPVQLCMKMVPFIGGVTGALLVFFKKG